MVKKRLKEKGVFFVDTKSKITAITVKGYVYHIDTNPVDGLTISIYEKSLRERNLIGKTKTGISGYYEIKLDPGSFKLSLKNPVFQVEVQENNEKTILASDLFEVKTVVNELNFIIDNPKYKGLSKYQTTGESLKSLVGKLPYTEINENAVQKDISFLSLQTGKPAKELALYIKARQFSEKTNIAADVYYALMKMGFPRDLEAILQNEREVIGKTLDEAASKNIIDQKIIQNRNSILSQMNYALADISLAKKLKKSETSLGEILSLAISDLNMQKKALVIYNEHTGSIQDYWKKLKKELGQEDTVVKMQNAIRLAAVTGCQNDLVEYLLRDKKLMTDNRLSALAQWDKSDWQKTIKLVSEQKKKLCVPPVIEGRDDEEKITKYAAKMTEIMHGLFPTAAFAGKLAKDSNIDSPFAQTRDDLKTFFYNNPGFDFRFNPTYTLKSKETSYDFSGVRDKEAMVKEMQSIQRVYKLTPKYEAISALKADGLDSAYSIIQTPVTEYLKYAPSLGGESAVSKMYAKAEKTYMQSMEIMTRLNPGLNLAPYVVPSLSTSTISDPDLRTMFGSLEQCDCCHCRSVYSPAAYLVDILNFLQKRSPAGAFNEFKRRRGDILNIELTCINTNTPLPYVDLVLERLEKLVLNRQNPAVSLIASYQTTGFANELAANPEYYNKDAYTVLKKAVHPDILPFNLPLEEARVYLNHLGVSRAELMKTFFPVNPSTDPHDPGDYTLAAERLGLAPEEADIVTGQTTGSTESGISSGIWNFYGFDKENGFTPIPDPADSGLTLTGNWANVLANRVDVFLQQTGLQYQDLLYLLTTDFINPVTGSGSRRIAIVSKDPDRPDTCVLKDLYLRNLNTTDLAKIYKLIRLWRKLGLSMYDLDIILCSFALQLNSSQDLIKISNLILLAERFKLNVKEIVSFFFELNTKQYRDYEQDGQPLMPSFYDSLFRNKAVINPLDNAYTDIINGSSVNFTDHLATILAALQISGNDLEILAFNLGIETSGNTLNKSVLSNLYRNARFSRCLGLSIKDYLTAKSLIGSNPFNSLTDLINFMSKLETLKTSGFSITQLDYLLRHIYTESTDVKPQTQTIATFLAELRSELKKVDLKVIPEMTATEIAAAQNAANEERRKIVKQKFAEKMKISTAASSLILSDALASTANPGISIIDDFLDLSYIAGDNQLEIVTSGAEAGKSVAFPVLFANYLLIDKVITILKILKITDEEMEYILKHFSDFGILASKNLPVTPTDNAHFSEFEKLINLIKARDILPFGTPAFFDIYKNTIDSTIPPADAKEKWLNRLEERSHWGNSIQDLLGLKNELSGGGILKTNFPTDYKNGSLLLKVKECLDLLRRLGLTVPQLKKLIRSDLDDDCSCNVKNAAKAKYDEQQWYILAKPLRDELREKQRLAMVTYVVAHPDKTKHQIWKKAEELYEYLLLDVEMTPVMVTSRIKQAISSVQLFIDRVLMNLEHANMDKTTPALKLNVAQVKEWKEWRKLYRIWEANRKVFLYPENWIEPELRDDKSPLYKQLEATLLQNELTAENVEDAFLGYLEKLDSIARLEIKSIYHQKDEQNGIDVIHILGRTYSIPHKYYYRKFSDGEWTAWEKIDLDIEGDHVIPVVWNRRLHIFWLIFTEKTIQSDITMPAENQALAKPPKYWQIQLAWSEFKKNKWTAKKMSRQNLGSYAFRENDITYIKDWAYFYSKPVKEIINIDGKTKEINKLHLIITEYATAKVSLPSGRFVFINSNTEPIPEYCFGGDPQIYAPTGTSIANSMFWGYSALLRDNGYSLKSQDVYTPWHSTIKCDVFDSTGNTPILANTPYGDYSLVTKSDSFINPLDDSFFIQDSQNTLFALYERELVEDSITIHEPDNSYIDMIDDFWRHWYYVEETIPIPGPEPDPFEDPLWDPSQVTVDNPAVKVENPADSITSIFDSIAGKDSTFMSLNGEIYKGSDVIKNVPGRMDNYQPAGVYAQTMTAKSFNTGNMAMTVKSNTVNTATNTPVRYMPNESAEVIAQQAERVHVYGRNSYTVKTYHYEDHYTFSAHFHAQVQEFIKELNYLGIEGLLTRSVQSPPDTMHFKDMYKPNSVLVKDNYPTDQVDFQYGGAYSQYNWELFFHIPVMIAVKLSLDQRFEEARKWFHYVFDPTNSEGGGKERFWQFKPFYDKAMEPIQTLDDLMRNAVELAEQVDKWMKYPFKPHIIARMRYLAYMKNVVMKYIDNLISWADQLFRRDTIESINEATQLYVLGAKILGERPEKVLPRAVPEVQTFEDLDDKLDAFSNAMVDIELYIDPSAPPSSTGGVGSSLGKMAYFCIAKNENLINYWDTVADRLFKIRHGMNIEGIVRQLPLFEPPIDPALLVKAAAAGIDLSSIINDITAAKPYYRFSYLLQKANELCNDVKMLGSTLLSALEKKDAEALSLIRQVQEIKVLEAARNVKAAQVDEATENMEALKKQRDVVQLKYNYYSTRPYMNQKEKQHLDSLQLGMVFQTLQGEMETIAAVCAAIPDFKLGTPTTIGATFGGSNVSSIMKAIGSFLGIFAGINNTIGTMASTLGSYDRRRDDWKFQADSALKELTQLDKQINAAAIRIAISEKELSNHDLQIDNSKETEEFMRSKYTNQELYDWMIGQISTVYFQSYQLAYDLAKKAEICYRYELGISNTSFIQFGYWDSLKKGLLSGDKLQYDLRRMDTSYLEHNKRDFELTKHISVALLDPVALMNLRANGKCTVTIPETLFDFDYSGHYFRRIKTVSLSIPCVAGPYITINCTLRLKWHATRINTTGTTYECTDYTVDSSRFNYVPNENQSVALSGSQNDSGMFDLNLRDERYLPFEGCGAVSQWDIELSDDQALRLFDYSTIADIIIHMKYTAREDVGEFKTRAKNYLKDVINGIKSASNAISLRRLISARLEFPAQWYKFLHPETAGADNILELNITKESFPFFTQDDTVKITYLDIYAKCKNSTGYIVRLSPPVGETTADLFSLAYADATCKMHYSHKDVSAKTINLVTSSDSVWKLKFGKEAAPGTTDPYSFNCITPDEVTDIFIVLGYKLI
jgi:hypothetical protein